MKGTCSFAASLGLSSVLCNSRCSRGGGAALPDQAAPPGATKLVRGGGLSSRGGTCFLHLVSLGHQPLIWAPCFGLWQLPNLHSMRLCMTIRHCGQVSSMHCVIQNLSVRMNGQVLSSGITLTSTHRSGLLFAVQTRWGMPHCRI